MANGNANGGDHLTVVPPERREAADGEHPILTARRALLEASMMSRNEDWAYTLRRFANTLPEPEWLDRR